MGEVAAEHGVDLSAYRGWPRFCVGGDDDHPSTMGAVALRAALARAGRTAESLAMVLFVGMSRDYLPSWSVATEIMRLLEAPETCRGIDLTVGCLGGLTGLDLAQAWLAGGQGGTIAIVAAERWSHTVTRTNGSTVDLWAYSDGASAIVVGPESSEPALATYRGACFTSNASFNGVVLVEYGGTRNPIAPEGVSPFARKMGNQTRGDIFRSYLKNYGRVFADLSQRFDGKADALVCNQISPHVVRAISEAAGVDDALVCRTGPELGHVGSADLFIGLARLAEAGRLRGNVLVGASSPYAFGAGVLTA